jgi:hypothetical protein
MAKDTKPQAAVPETAQPDPRPINRSPEFAVDLRNTGMAQAPGAASTDEGAVAFKPGQPPQRISPDAVEGSNRTMGGGRHHRRKIGPAPDDGAALPMTKAAEGGVTHGGEDDTDVHAEGDLEGDRELPESLPDAVKLNAPHGFVDGEGVHHFWPAGAIEDHPEKVKLLLRRGADVTQYDRSVDKAE